MDEERLRNERSGFKNFLWILLVGFSVICLMDFFFRDMPISFIFPIISLNVCVLLCLLFLKKRFWQQFSFIALVVAIGIFLTVRTLQGAFSGDSLMLVLILAFLGSVLLKGKSRVYTHCGTIGYCILLVGFLIWKAPVVQPIEYWNVFRGLIVFTTIYVAIAYPTGFIQDRLDQERSALKIVNENLQKQNVEKEIRQSQLIAAQNQISQINQNLEKIVNERTKKLSDKNSHLISLSFQHAHTLRAPLARILGLITLAGLEGPSAYNDLIPKIQMQAKEMDEAVKKIGMEINDNIDKTQL